MGNNIPNNIETNQKIQIEFNVGSSVKEITYGIVASFIVIEITKKIFDKNIVDTYKNVFKI